ncbi:DUF494 family protein [Orenia marismortui]|uniref:DUF494 family protein n=1 Tax=Orenia marismortui TaxID=46469 RepID=UPI000371E295|nr:DUF494 family protein [Orenia marismortui]
MNQNIFEIISQLVKRLLHDGEIIQDEEKLINSLREEGYNLDDISQAFEFIFSSSEIIDLPENKSNKTNNKRFKNRVLDFREKSKFDIEVQGIIMKLNVLNLLRDGELEKVITRCLVGSNKVIDISDLWKVLKEVVNNELRLAIISNEIKEFKDNDIKLDNNYIN